MTSSETSESETWDCLSCGGSGTFHHRRGDEPYLWLGIDKTGRNQIEDLSRIHLTFEQAEQIISTLRAAMAIHYQGSDSPRRKEN